MGDTVLDLFAEDKNIGVLLHDDPDPDALATGYALHEYGGQQDVDVDVLYNGEISHPPNKDFAEILGVPLTSYTADGKAFSTYDELVLVDTHGGKLGTDAFQEHVTGIIDHHTNNGGNGYHYPGLEEAYTHIVEDASSTATIITELFNQDGAVIREDVAACLIRGLEADTYDLLDPREGDSDALETLTGTLERSVNHWRNHDTYKELRQVEDDWFAYITYDKTSGTTSLDGFDTAKICALGDLASEKDGGKNWVWSTANQEIINAEEDTFLIAYGVEDETIHLSVRAKFADETPDYDIETDLRILALFDEQIEEGNLGGKHGNRIHDAGGQIPLGDVRTALVEQLAAKIGQGVADRVTPEDADKVLDQFSTYLEDEFLTEE